MNNRLSSMQQSPALRTLAVIGFVGVLILAIWLIVQIVRIAPAGFSMLASVVTDEQTTERFLTTADTQIAESGEDVTIAWTTLPEAGEYAFSYTCADTVSAEIDFGDNTQEISCDDRIILPEDEQRITVRFRASGSRFTDVHYTVAYTSATNERALERGGVVTVVADTPAPSVADTQPDSEDGESAADTPTRTVPTTVTRVPESDPNGYADLAVSFVGIGEYRSNRYYPRAQLRAYEPGAVRIRVTNIGTKTSSAWYFTTVLPTDPAYTYTSTAQAPLRPNESQIITLGFDEAVDAHRAIVSGVVTSTGDAAASNNNFSVRVNIDN